MTESHLQVHMNIIQISPLILVCYHAGKREVEAFLQTNPDARDDAKVQLIKTKDLMKEQSKDTNFLLN